MVSWSPEAQVRAPREPATPVTAALCSAEQDFQGCLEGAEQRGIVIYGPGARIPVYEHMMAGLYTNTEKEKKYEDAKENVR